ncbi:transcriptional regulator with PAS, ATPase and Fis domain [Mycoplana sp. BE70]|uniref:sigma 54-interacting transcriptional regulator n=1 Tax=Mycoplana sp. BE70 TaxID=2817775 RepID=UPI00285E9914|nr:sigma 54-interacting transcriptional regulator [Mycoplana sp. BE70]MDR6759140.1 transcriptional regulator with PAS, ATPase and Fis domain [Mycoplana sp. BE70]
MKFYSNDITNLSSRRLRPGFIDDPQFASFLEALPDGAALLDTDGRIKLVNAKIEMLLNLGRRDLVGTDLAKHAKTAGPVVAKLWTGLQQLKRTEVTGALNSQRQVVAAITILRTQDGGAYGALLTMREANRASRPVDGSENFRFDETSTRTKTSFLSTPHSVALSTRAEAALARGASVLLTGETGTGKTEMARLIGRANDAGAPPFVHVRCGLISDGQFEAEMFGIEPGSRLDTSTRGKLGYVEAADGGILFLDQITDLGPSAQAMLVAFLETQTFSRVGSAQRRHAKLQIIAATNADMDELMGEGLFRRDLYYRVAVMTFDLPPLRGDTAVIDTLLDHHLAALNVGRKPVLRLSSEFRELAHAHQYPGNIRELINILERAGASASELASAEHFIGPSAGSARPASPVNQAPPHPIGSRAGNFKDLVQEFETWVLEKSIAENGSKRSAAKALGIDIATLVRKTKRRS